MLDLVDVSLSFGGLLALNDFQLSLEEGELVGLIGPNGAGKSTAFNVVSGIYAPNKGTVRWQGDDITGLAAHEITARGISRTFQTIRLFPDLSVIENVLVASHRHRGYGLWQAALRSRRYAERERRIADEATALLATLGLHERRHDPAGALPYGEQRRLEIARALATKPRLLLLDEPAAGMNPAEVSQLMELIVKIKADHGLTILLIEHHMRVVMGVCERIAVLDFGVKIAEGTPQEIRADPRVLEAYLGQTTEGEAA